MAETPKPMGPALLAAHDYWQARAARMERERDEALRDACDTLAEWGPKLPQRVTAEQRGWSYLYEGGKGGLVDIATAVQGRPGMVGDGGAGFAEALRRLYPETEGENAEAHEICGCSSCPHAGTPRSRRGRVAVTTCDEQGGRIVAYGHSVPDTRPEGFPLDSEACPACGRAEGHKVSCHPYMREGGK